MRTHKGTPKGSNDLRSHPVAMLLLYYYEEKYAGMRRTYFRTGLLLMTLFWRHFRSKLYYYASKKKKTRKKSGHAQNILPVRATSGHGLFRLRDFFTSGQKSPLGRILRNFRLHMRMTLFRTGYVTDATSGHATSGSTSQHLRKYDLSCAHILLLLIRKVRSHTRC